MPRTEVVYYADEDGSAPAREWLWSLPEPAQDRFLTRFERLAELGSDPHRPEADFLRDGIYELRVRHRHANYRILYFFSGGRAVLCHGCSKERGVPSQDIERALKRRALYRQEPDRHTYERE